MWISFACPFAKKYSIRPYTGGINGISGRTAAEDICTLDEYPKVPFKEQDYFVLPGQARLDGIATDPNTVKQFIATQRIPSSEQAAELLTGEAPKVDFGIPKDFRSHRSINTSIEWQMTGRGTMGGVQFQIIPEHDVDNMRFSNMPNIIFQDGYADSYFTPTPRNARDFDALKTPGELNLKTGDLLYVKNMREVQPERSKTVRDLWFESPSSLKSSDVIELESCYTAPLVRKLVVHQPNTNSAPVSFEVRVKEFF